MTTIEHHFPNLEAPPGGLARLRFRLDRHSHERRFRPSAAVALLVGVTVPLVWLFEVGETRYRQTVQIEELRQTLSEHRSPPLAIDGRAPRRVALDSNRVEAYFVNGGG